MIIIWPNLEWLQTVAVQENETDITLQAQGQNILVLHKRLIWGNWAQLPARI